MPLVRSTPMIIKATDYPLWYVATTRQRNKYFNAQFRLWGIEHNIEIESLGQQILDILANTPITEQTITDRLPADSKQELSQTSRGGRVTTTNNITLALQWLVATGQLYAINNSPNWPTETVSYAPPSHCYPGLNLAQLPSRPQQLLSFWKKPL